MMAFISGFPRGIMDHDSVGGALDFIEAEILHMPVTVGMNPVICPQPDWPGKELTNPDQN